MDAFAELGRRHFFDALAGAAVISMAVEMLGKEPLPGPAFLTAALAAPTCLFARRWFPFGAPVAAVALVAAAVSIDVGAAYDSGTPFFMSMVASWALGNSGSARSALLGLGVVLGAAFYITDKFPDTGISDFFWISTGFGTIWLVGFLFGTRSAQAEAAEERARRLELAHEEAAVRAVSDERRRIARELHDVVAHSVSVMTVQAGAVRRLLRDDQEREREALVTIEETGRQALAEMRRLLGMLRDANETPTLAPQPSLRTLDALVGQVREAGLPVEVRVEGEPVDLPPGVDLSAYRIVQEALTNALKHAGPAQAEVRVRYRTDSVELEISNDGRSGGNGGRGGHGIAGMRERVAVFGGELESGPREGGGYVVRARLPLEQAP